jgi:hypothetical protein
MPTRKCCELPGSLSRLGQRFAAWRKTRLSGQRIPESLWKSAAKVAAKHGVNRTARALNLDYYCLKERMDAASIGGASSQAKSTFVELPSSPLSIMSECVIEWEDATGSRMRVHLKGQDGPDLLALSRSFWNSD